MQLQRIAVTDPSYYEISYAINPWMQPNVWHQHAGTLARAATQSWTKLVERLREARVTVEIIPPVPGLPDLVFPANAAIVLDGRALLSRFRHFERRGEEAVFRAFFETAQQNGLIAEIVEFPEGMFQEGAGDCIWDTHRRMFWAGYGPRSDKAAIDHIKRTFGQHVASLELSTDKFYHLDTCFCPLPGGEVLYCPEAFTSAAQSAIAALIPDDCRIAASMDEAASFSLNAVSLGRDLIMAPPPARLRDELERRGYRCRDIDLSAFMLSGGAAYCMTLRLDLRSNAELPGHTAACN